MKEKLQQIERMATEEIAAVRTNAENQAEALPSLLTEKSRISEEKPPILHRFW